MTNRPFLAIDLGASSGRAVLGSLESGRLDLAEIHRFENHAVRLKDTVIWDFPHLWHQVLEALSLCAGAGQGELAGIGVDAWNLDFGLVDQAGMLLANPISYRDQGAVGVSAQISERTGDFHLYQRTGMPVFPITGLARLLHLRQGPSRGILELAHWYLPIPDLVRFYLLGGASEGASIEQTISWGTQLVDIHTRRWSEQLVADFGIPRRLLPNLIPPATVTGTLGPSVAEITGTAECPIVAVAEHDTISAALVANALDPEAAVLSVGTWSIFGRLVEIPVVTREARDSGFMNELAFGQVFLARNLMGFYLLEEFIRSWRTAGVEHDYQELVELARAAAPGGLTIDPNDPVFFAPLNLQQVFRDYCARTGQGTDVGIGAIVRGLYEGLAASYATAFQDLCGLTGPGPRRIVMVGGGVRSDWLCQLVADACRSEVIAGPAEATVIGNLCVQALALGRVRAGEIQSLLRASFPIRSFRPSEGGRRRDRSASR